jgi:phosphate transport system ATP-binding protein
MMWDENGDEYSVQTRALDLWYGDFQALRQVSLDLRRGRITSLIGPSGCGKTTLLRCFNRINERYGNVRTHGEIRILGRNIYDPEIALGQLRRTVGMVFQRPNPLPISIFENLVLGLRLHYPRTSLRRSALEEIVETSLQEVGLWHEVKDRLDQPATALQLEEQQKLCIARLLPLKPHVILLDEPCSALDVEGTRAIEELMFRLREHYTLLIVTHNMAQARRASDECLFMLLGEVLEYGPTQELFASPQHPRTADYLAGRFG